MKPKAAVIIDNNSANKKVYFGDDGGIVDKLRGGENPVKLDKSEIENVSKTKKQAFNKKQQNWEDVEKKWYQVYEEHNTSEFKEIKDSDLTALQQLCKSSFNDVIQKLSRSMIIIGLLSN